jgi:hypothetical protein
MNIAKVIPQDNYILYITSDDGKTGLFDVKPYLESEVFAPLRDKSEFERIHNGKYFIEWDCGAGLSVDTIQARWQITSTENAQQGAPAERSTATRFHAG